MSMGADCTVHHQSLTNGDLPSGRGFRRRSCIGARQGGINQVLPRIRFSKNGVARANPSTCRLAGEGAGAAMTTGRRKKKADLPIATGRRWVEICRLVLTFDIICKNSPNQVIRFPADTRSSAGRPLHSYGYGQPKSLPLVLLEDCRSERRRSRRPWFVLFEPLPWVRSGNGVEGVNVSVLYQAQKRHDYYPYFFDKNQ